MEIEYFDEPRQCANCRVVTYCDRCPICGKLLPRSDYRKGKRMKAYMTAGEEMISQPQNHEIHRGHIKERIIESKQVQSKAVEAFHKAVNKNKQAKSSADDLIDQTQGRQSRKKHSRPLRNGAKLALIFAVTAVSIGIGINAFLHASDETGEESEEYTSSFYEDKITLSLEPIEARLAIYDEVELYNAMYAEYDDTIRAYIRNKRNDCRRIDMSFYSYGDEDGAVSDVLLMPYENTDLVIDAEYIPDAYEMIDNSICEIGSTAPDFTYKTYWGNEMMSAIVDSQITQSDVEILVRYLYEASQYRDWDEVKTMLIYLNNGKNYAFTLTDGKATGVYSGHSLDGFEPLEIVF